jgi:hypothetical protein
MNNSDNNEDDKVVLVFGESEIKNERKKLEEEIKELYEKMKVDTKKHEKYMKRMKAFSISLIIYLITIVIVAVSMIAFPSFRPIGTIYLFVCNILGACLCGWNIIHLFQTGLIKEFAGKWLLVLGIFGVLVNVFAIFDDFILRRFF